jgi:hypothetical protein
MPVLHQYEDESGYYFRAKPSGLNTPITYQVHDSARSFFCDLGYRDGDSVPWEVIQPLRARLVTFTQMDKMSKKGSLQT